MKNAWPWISCSVPRSNSENEDEATYSVRVLALACHSFKGNQIKEAYQYRPLRQDLAGRSTLERSANADPISMKSTEKGGSPTAPVTAVTSTPCSSEDRLMYP